MAAPKPHTASSFYGRGFRHQPVRMLPIPDGSEDELDSDDDGNDSVGDEDYNPDDTSEESESDDDTNPPPPPDDPPTGKTKSTQQKTVVDKHTFEWNRGKQLTYPPEADFPDEKLRINPTSPKTTNINEHSVPLTFFLLFLDTDYMEEVTYQTHLYITQQAHSGSTSRPITPVKKEEVYAAFGIILFMGIVRLPNRRMYWSPTTKVDAIVDGMTRNRFEEIVSHLHFNDNTNQKQPNEEGYNKLFKIQPLLDHLKQQFKAVVFPETCQAIDEMVISFKVRHSLKRYLSKKPTKWGYKLWTRAGASGYVYDFQVCGGKDTGPPEGTNVPPGIGESGFVVLRLVEALPALKHKIFFDNYFSSPELLVFLRDGGHFAVSTIQENRTRNCPIKTEKELKKKGRGAIDECVDKDDKLAICAWLDTKRVLMASNYIGAEPVGECKRFDRKSKAEITISRPAAVTTYNKFMGGVDKADMMLALYKSRFRSRKWYLRFVSHLLSLCVVNGWTIYRQLGGTGSMVDFSLQIAQSLIVGSVEETSSEEPPAKRPMRTLNGRHVPKRIREDKLNHWPFQMEGRAQRCKHGGCSRRSRFMCSKCQVYLCVIGSGCFLEFHDVSNN